VKGVVAYLYAFDVASEIRTPLVREILSQRPFPFQIRMGRTVPRDLAVYQPLTIGLNPAEWDASVGAITLKSFVKIFDFGVVSISYEVAFEVSAIGDLLPYHRLRVGDTPLAALAQQLAGHVSEGLAPYLVKPNRVRRDPEAYTAFCFSEVDDLADTASVWAARHRVALAGLLLEEPASFDLSLSQIDERFRHTLSYAKDDAVVIDWDAAVVVDRSGYFDDVMYVLELANLQLEQLRLLDDRLDRYIVRSYDDLERYYASHRFVREPRSTLATLRAIRMDASKISEEATNVTKFVGDWYLARVYVACKDRFYIGHWDQSVDRKLRQLDELYSMVHEEIQSRRMFVMEAVVIALFLMEIALALFKK
jgi:hypothetical protein